MGNWDAGDAETESGLAGGNDTRKPAASDLAHRQTQQSISARRGRHNVDVPRRTPTGNTLGARRHLKWVD